MSDEIEITDFTWALFNGDTQVTEWHAPNATMRGPDATVTEIRYQWVGGEIRQSFLQAIGDGDEVHPGKVIAYAPSGNDDRVYTLLAYLMQSVEESP